MDYNVNVCIYCFESVILTYSDFIFDNVNFDFFCDYDFIVYDEVSILIISSPES